VIEMAAPCDVFKIVVDLLATNPRSWFGSRHIVWDEERQKYFFVPDGGWVGDYYVTEHPNYIGTLEGVLGKEVCVLIERLRKVLYEVYDGP